MRFQVEDGRDLVRVRVLRMGGLDGLYVDWLIDCVCRERGAV